MKTGGCGYGLRFGSREVLQRPDISAVKDSVLFQGYNDRWGIRGCLVDSGFSKLRFELRHHVSCIADEVVS